MSRLVRYYTNIYRLVGPKSPDGWYLPLQTIATGLELPDVTPTAMHIVVAASVEHHA